MQGLWKIKIEQDFSMITLQGSYFD